MQHGKQNEENIQHFGHWGRGIRLLSYSESCSSFCTLDDIVLYESPSSQFLWLHFTDESPTLQVKVPCFSRQFLKKKKQTVTERIFPSSHLVHFVSAFLSSRICCLSHTFTRPKGLLCFLALPNSSKFFQKQLLSIFKRLRSLNLKRGANWGLYRLVSLLQSMLQ